MALFYCAELSGPSIAIFFEIMEDFGPLILDELALAWAKRKGNSGVLFSLSTYLT